MSGPGLDLLCLDLEGLGVGVSPLGLGLDQFCSSAVFPSKCH